MYTKCYQKIVVGLVLKMKPVSKALKRTKIKDIVCLNRYNENLLQVYMSHNLKQLLSLQDNLKFIKTSLTMKTK